MVSLTMVENYVKELWPEYDQAIITVSDDKKGEQLVLVTTNKDAAREFIVKHVKQHALPEISIPKKIIYVSKMPLLGSGKISYVALKELYA